MSRVVVVLGHRSGSRVGRIVEEEGRYLFQPYIGDGFEDYYGEAVEETNPMYDLALQMVGKIIDDHVNGQPPSPELANQKAIAKGKSMVLGFPIHYHIDGQYFYIPPEITEVYPELRKATNDGSGKCRKGFYKLPKNWFFQTVLVPPGGNLK